MYSLDNLPPELSSKPLEHKEVFLKAYVNAVQQGRTNDEAYISGIGAVNIIKTKQRLDNKKNLSVKQNDLTVNKQNKIVPSHLLNLLSDVKTSNTIQKVENEVTGNNDNSTSLNFIKKIDGN